MNFHTKLFSNQDKFYSSNDALELARMKVYLKFVSYLNLCSSRSLVNKSMLVTVSCEGGMIKIAQCRRARLPCPQAHPFCIEALGFPLEGHGCVLLTALIVDGWCRRFARLDMERVD